MTQKCIVSGDRQRWIGTLANVELLNRGTFELLN